MMESKTNLYPPVKLKPIATPRMWGGNQLKSWFGAEHIAQPIGEYWLVSGHPSATSVVEAGPFAGQTLAQLTEQYPATYLGSSAQPRFPLLVKVIEASADLSVQVHPDDAYAQAHEGDYGKTEAWYILDAPDHGKVVSGHRFRDRAEYSQAVEAGRVEEFLAYRDIHAGDVVYVPAKTLHALLAGTMVIEVQQTSDITYRVYDWGRVGANGQSRQLHVAKAADVLDYNAPALPAVRPTPIPAETGVEREHLLDCTRFTMERIAVTPGATHLLEQHGGPSVVVGVSGQGRVGWGEDDTVLQRGDAWLIPSQRDDVTMKASETELVVLRITY